jgi:hypothetical protein
MVTLESTRAPGFLRYFRPEVEASIKMIGAIGLLSVVVLSLAWGYEQRRQARSWRQLACTYRLQDSVRRAPFMSNVLHTPDACATMDELGLKLDVPRLSPAADVSVDLPRAYRGREGS